MCRRLQFGDLCTKISVHGNPPFSRIYLTVVYKFLWHSLSSLLQISLFVGASSATNNILAHLNQKISSVALSLQSPEPICVPCKKVNYKHAKMHYILARSGALRNFYSLFCRPLSPQKFSFSLL